MIYLKHTIIVLLLFFCTYANSQSSLNFKDASTGYVYPGIAGEFNYDRYVTDSKYCYSNLDWMGRYITYTSLKLPEIKSNLKTHQHYFSTVMSDTRVNNRANLILLDFGINVFKPNVFKDKILQRKYDGSIVDNSKGQSDVFDFDRLSFIGFQLPKEYSNTNIDLYFNPSLYVTNLNPKNTNYSIELTTNKSSYFVKFGKHVSIPTAELLNDVWTIKIYKGKTLLNTICYSLKGKPHNPESLDLGDFNSDHILTSVDTDKDGIPDIYDNCPKTYNQDQFDIDGDGIGDVCNNDLDGDGIQNSLDNCIYTINPSQDDLDGDGIGDVCDDDWDNDLIPNSFDNCPLLPNFNQFDRDEDGMGDVCDYDIDGDGLANEDDNCPYDSNSDQADLDQDGIGDICDRDIDGDGLDNSDDECPLDPLNTCNFDTPELTENCKLSPTEEGNFIGTQEFIVGPTGTPNADLIVPNAIDFETYGNLGVPGINTLSSGEIDYELYVNPSRSEVKAPLVIVDGFDPLGQRKIDDIIEIIGGDDRIAEYWEDGFDVYFVDFVGGGDFMQRNALVLQDFIVDIKTQHNLETIPAVVGPSMGGQIVRYMLLDWEQNKVDQFGEHGIQAFVSIDSPWEGANVAPSLQTFIKKLNFMVSKFPFNTNSLNVLVYNKLQGQANTIVNNDILINSPAARQMLLLHVNNTKFSHTSYNEGIFLQSAPHSYREDWINELDALGDIPDLPIIATADGSDAGSNGNHPPGEAYFLIDIELPFNISYPFSKLKTLGEPTLILGYLTVLTNQSGDLIDSSPGSQFPLEKNLGNIEDSQIVDENLSFCFIPTYSALGLDEFVDPIPMNNGQVVGSPFDYTFVDSNDSEHIAFDNMNYIDGVLNSDFTFIANNLESGETGYDQCDQLHAITNGDLPLLEENQFEITCEFGALGFESSCINFFLAEDVDFTINPLTDADCFFVNVFDNVLFIENNQSSQCSGSVQYELCAEVNLDDCTSADPVCQTFSIIRDQESCNGMFLEDETEENKKEIDTRAEIETESKELKIIPNPNKGHFKISNNEPGHVQLIDINGKTVKSQTVKNENADIEFDGIPGLYFVKFISKNGKEYETSRVIIQ